MEVASVGRRGENVYRFRSLKSGYEADIEVDDLGLVITYAGVWERVATFNHG
ncbi:MAG: putative glycolipid-binding domain-containing protein [Fidelibacterota bacterium]